MGVDDVLWSRWDDVDRLFTLAMTRPASERVVYVERACAGDDELRRLVLRLLELTATQDERGLAPGPALLRAAYARGEAALAEDDGELEPGERIGRYRIVGVLGRGGMATVYEAERDDGAYRQRLALKLLRRGRDSDLIVRRFLGERQILSSFAHPNIARLLDGGATADGRPFLAVEKVDGRPITEWADAHRLDVRARLTLFLQVTEAVREAHRRLIVHRDLKPSNILVDDDGQVKLLDFGIAKLLDAERAAADLTRLGPYPLTPRYASPEQARGEDVTASSDVYQLGLVLYQLLSGVWPFSEEERTGAPGQRDEPRPASRAFDAAGEETARLARLRGTTPRGLSRALTGDLDTILSRALEAEPLDRYRSVEDLATDIRLHLGGRPIFARPASRILRLRKWAKRNPWAPPVVAALTVIMIGYVATLTISAARLERERNDARAQAERAENIKQFLIDVFRTADPFEGGDPAASADLTVAEALSSAAARVRAELRDEPSMQADLLAAIASIFENVDRTDESRLLIEEALAIRRALGQERSPEFVADLLVLAQVVDHAAPDSAARVLARAVEIARATLPPDDPRMADALAEFAWVRVAHLNVYDAESGEEALAIYEAAGSRYQARSAAVLGTLSDIYRHTGRMDEAEEAARESLRRHRAAAGEEHPLSALAAVRLAGVLDGRQRFEESIALYRHALPVMERTAGATHNQTLVTRNNLATTLQAAGKPGEAVAMHREILTALRAKAGTELHREVASTLQNLATALKEQGRLHEADSIAARAHDIYARTTPPGHYLRAFPLLTRAEILLRQAEPERAADVAARALVILEPALGDHFAVGVARCRLGQALLAAGQPEAGAPHVRSALTLLQADERTPPAYLDECALAADVLEGDPLGPADGGPGGETATSGS